MLSKAQKVLDTIQVNHNKDKLKLCIYGDSFADPTNTEMCDPDHIGHEPWPSLVAEYFLSLSGEILSEQGHEDLLRGHLHKGPVEIKGRGGTNLWWSLKNLVSDINASKSIENVVFVHTNPQRILSLLEPDETKAFLSPDFSALEEELSDAKQDSDELQQFVNLYYKYSHDELLNDMFGQMVFDTVQDLARKHKFKLINIMPFRNSGGTIPGLPDVPIVDVSERAGPVISGLQNVCFAESGSPSRYLHRNDFHDTWQGSYKDARNPNWASEDANRDLRLCHMNVDNNCLVAQTIIDMFSHLNEVDPKHGGSLIVDLYHEGKFVSSPKKWSYYNSAEWSNKHYED